MRYGDYMLTHTRLDRIRMEHAQYVSLLTNLTNGWMTYASHKVTGVVYDMDVIKGHIEKLSEEIAELEKELERG